MHENNVSNTEFMFKVNINYSYIDVNKKTAWFEFKIIEPI